MTVSETIALIENNVIMHHLTGAGIWIREPSLPEVRNNEIKENEV
jgi:hypothetical protein